MNGLKPEQEKPMKDAMHVTDAVLADIFAPDEASVRRICKACGEPYEHPDSSVRFCRDCCCAGETCQWRIVKASTDENGNTFGIKQCFTPGCGRRKEFEA